MESHHHPSSSGARNMNNVNRSLLVQDSPDVISSDSLVTQEHSLQLVENLKKIYDEEDCFLYDVTLVSKDNVEVRAHKVILAAQSDFFKVNIHTCFKSYN